MDGGTLRPGLGDVVYLEEEKITSFPAWLSLDPPCGLGNIITLDCLRHMHIQRKYTDCA